MPFFFEIKILYIKLVVKLKDIRMITPLCNRAIPFRRLFIPFTVLNNNTLINL